MNTAAHVQGLPRAASARVLACGALLKNRAVRLDGDQAHWTALNGGLGDWALAQSGASFIATFYDNGKTGKASADTFGINIQYTPVSPQPSTLPNSAPQPLKGGNITVK